MRPTLLSLLLTLSAACGGTGTVGSRRIDSRGTGSLQAGTGLAYGGGPVLTGDLHLYIIWYGKDFRHKTQLRNFIHDLDGSSYWKTVTQFYDAAGRHPSGRIRIAGQWNETVLRYGRVLTDRHTERAHVEGESSSLVRDAIRGHHLPSDEHGLYLIAIGNDVTADYADARAYHGYTTRLPGKRIPYTAIDHNDFFALAHELAEAVTDPIDHAWLWNEEEIADLCQGHDKTMRLGSHSYVLQPFANLQGVCSYHL
jgi:hypothetical protein